MECLGPCDCGNCQASGLWGPLGRLERAQGRMDASLCQSPLRCAPRRCTAKSHQQAGGGTGDLTAGQPAAGVLHCSASPRPLPASMSLGGREGTGRGDHPSCQPATHPPGSTCFHWALGPRTLGCFGCSLSCPLRFGGEGWTAGSTGSTCNCSVSPWDSESREADQGCFGL